MSGLVSTYSAWSRAQSRCSRGAVAVVGGRPGRRARAPSSRPSWSWASALVGREVERGRAALPARPAGGADRRSAPAAGRPATCRRGAGGHHDVPARRAPPRRPRPGAATARAPRGPRTPRRTSSGDPVRPRPRSAPPGRAAPRGGSAAPRGRAPPRAAPPRRASSGRGPTTVAGTPRVSQTARTAARAGQLGRSRRPSTGCLLFPRTARRRGLIGARGAPRRALARPGHRRGQWRRRGPDSFDPRGRRRRPSSPSGARSTSTRRPSCATSSPSWSPTAPTTSSSTWRTSSSSTRPASASWSAV